MNRLSAGDLGHLDGPTPAYDRALPPSIVHLGVGAFARAHLGVYADDLLRGGWPATIAGVSLRSPRAEEQLAPQDGLYTVTEREPGSDDPPRIIGSFTTVETGSAAAVRAIAAPHVRLITLTVTEKGYETEDVPAVVARGLVAHRRNGTQPPVVASLDNLLDNGAVLRGAVLAAAERLDPLLGDWIAGHVAFPSSVVDRMVPATTAADLDGVAARLGVRDLGAVVAERHRSWVLEDVAGLPPLADVGVEVVGTVDAHQQRKLWLLNGPHSAVAYAGLLVGAGTIAEAAAHPVVAAFAGQLVGEVLEVAALPAALAPEAFAADALRRFRNPALGHRCTQVGADGSRKLPQRLLPVVSARRRRGLPTGRFALVTAAWIAAVIGLPVGGTLLPAIDDPAGDKLLAARRDGVVAIALGGYDDPLFTAEVEAALVRLAHQGAATLEEAR